MSGRLHIKDKFGNDLHFGNYGEFWAAPYPGVEDFREHLLAMKHLKMRKDDLIIAGFPRTGTHWHYELAKMLLKGTHHYQQSDGFKDFLEGTSVANLEPADSPRIFITHVRPQFLPSQVWEKQVKVLYHVRNPKDTWASLYSLCRTVRFGTPEGAYGGTWDQFFELMMDMGFFYGDWFDFVLSWEKHIDDKNKSHILTSYFEDLKRSPVEQILKIDKFLGTNRDRELCEKIAKAVEFTALKADMEKKMKDEIRKMMFTDGVQTLYRKGEIGDWKNWFTVSQDERFNAEYSKRMACSKLTFTYE